ncbi:DUF6705 family protein [Flavobacterium sp. SUN046]|uniref:DUF6705 family protein n=1 Tax=Flavobacterium sp. SUN046 TaxID=3002440 RepID=UPI002DB7631A|nr:DUF6705 family protein [Flavobacterium sp. SUN046]MEC4050992.1 DUF6705 family protein [Flavobacterium sp. SUN046]
MKKIFILLIIVQATLSRAQTYPLISPDAPSGSYIKDMNNEYDPYLGTWEGTWDNKKITFYLTKVEHQRINYSQDDYQYRDIVIAKYKVVDLTTGTIIEDSTNITDFDDIDLRATRVNRNYNFLDFLYFGRASKCGLNANVFMYRDLNNPNQLTYKYYVIGGLEPWWEGHCIYTSLDQIPVPIPKINVVLHKM